MNPQTIIDALRKSDEYIEDIFMLGGCYQFHLFLKAIFPEAIPYVSIRRSHIYTKIGDTFYDILGPLAEEDEDSIEPLNLERRPEVLEWSFHKNQWISLGDCPSCEEPLTI